MKRTVRQNAKSNFLAGLLPALILLITTPIVVRGLGIAEYGLLIVVTSVAGYLSVLDVNVTAGSVKFIAEATSAGDRNKVNSTVSFGLTVYFLIAVAGALLIWSSSSWLAGWFARSGQVGKSQVGQA